jgi:NTP pyrophosphatase (non-canonical NTP hydrolase)
MSLKDQREISQWAVDTFGDASSNMRVAIRANEEMSELLRALSADDNSAKAGAEIADIVIVLYRLADRMGLSLHHEVEIKMEINRNRVWVMSGDGHGHHVRNKTTETPVLQAPENPLIP